MFSPVGVMLLLLFKGYNCKTLKKYSEIVDEDLQISIKNALKKGDDYVPDKIGYDIIAHNMSTTAERFNTVRGSNLEDKKLYNFVGISSIPNPGILKKGEFLQSNQMWYILSTLLPYVGFINKYSFRDQYYEKHCLQNGLVTADKINENCFEKVKKY